MNRSIVSTPRIVIALVAVALMLAVVAGVSAYANQKRPGIPVTNVSHSIVDLGSGYTLELTGNTGKIVAPPVVLSPDTQKLDLGSGYTLELTGNTGKIVAPPVVLRPDTQKLDLGSGYTLELTGNTARIVAPTVVLSTAIQKLDLGSGYTLDLTGNTGKIVPPAPQPVTPEEPVKMDLGGGYWLIDGKVVKEGSR